MASYVRDTPEEAKELFGDLLISVTMFFRDPHNFQVLTEQVIARHSALKDPPFMRLDLVTCRNLLIYLDRPLQAQLSKVFHYALKPGRYLFLGSAEALDASNELFSPLHREARIYQARAQQPRILPQLPPFPDQPLTLATEPRRLSRDEGERSATFLHMQALERHSPPSVLIDDAQRIINLSPAAGRFIQHSGGPFTAELPSIVRPELRLDLKIAIERALSLHSPTLTLPNIVEFDGVRRRVSMHVSPVSDQPAAGQVLVIFLDGGEVDDGEAQAGADAVPRPAEARRLYEELKIAHEHLNASRREHEIATQDLRAANEELQSINEEYRSTAEERGALSTAVQFDR